MKRIAMLSALGVFIAAMTVSRASAQNAPLGDYARQARKQKGHAAPAAKTFDNDNLPKSDKLSVVGQAPEPAADAKPASNSETAPAATDAAAPLPGVGASGETTESGKGQTSAAGQTQTSQTQTNNEPKSPQDEQAERQKLYKEWQ